MDNSFVKTSDEVLKHFNVTINDGLSTEQVEKNVEEYGKNGIIYIYIILNFSGNKMKK